MRLSAFAAVALAIAGCGRTWDPSTGAVALPTLAENSPGGTHDAANWSAWRGAGHHGVAPDEPLPLEWSSAHGFRWKVDSGSGNSSPVVWQNRVFLTSAEESNGTLKLGVLCFDRADGRRLWRAVVDSPKNKTHGKNGYASASVATDGERVYAFFGSAGLLCYDFDGTRLWRATLGDLEHIWGTASSPVLYQGLVIQLCDHETDSYLAAFDKVSGKRVWRTPRDSYGCWTTPVVIGVKSDDGSQPHSELIVNGTGTADSGGGYVIAYDPLSGTERWRVQGTTDIVTPTAIVGGGMIYSTSGRNGPTIAIRPGGSGDVSDTHVVWKQRRGGAYVPTGVFYKDRLYTVADGGVASCYNAADGSLVWQQRLKGSFTSSLVAGADRIYAVNENGLVFVFEHGDKFRLLAENDMAESCLATPAVAGGEIFLRTEKHLYCIPAPPEASATADVNGDEAELAGADDEEVATNSESSTKPAVVTAVPVSHAEVNPLVGGNDPTQESRK